MATQLNDWLSIDKISGTGNAEITLTASSYSELVDRATSIKIQGISTNAILNVRQKAFNPNEEELKQKYFWIEFEDTGGEVRGIDRNKADMYYSFDGSTWKRCGILTTVSMNKNTIVYLKSNNKILFSSGPQTFKFNKNAKIGGPLSSIVDMYRSCCNYLFGQNQYLTDASDLILEWDSLSQRCYESMFGGCTSLTAAPALPATNLSEGCYSTMFSGCTSLTKAPELPATTLVLNCYNSMFQGCTSLTTAPELPVTTLVEGCYGSMFYNCTSLTTAPVLPATTLETRCYAAMFYGCTSLTKAPELPATTAVYLCYDSMFQGCTSLTKAPALPATILGRECYKDMFYGCTSLTKAPELPATTLAEECYSGMFYGCTSLNYIKMLATVWATRPLIKWVEGVSSTGTFIKHPDANIPTGANGIPSGWTVETATE